MYHTPIMPPQGSVVSDVMAPLTGDIAKIDLQTTKTGTAVVKNYLGIISVGDCSIETAAKNGGLKTINYADYKYFNVLGVYQEFTVIVYGN